MIYQRPDSEFFWYAFRFKGKRIQQSTKLTNRREAENIEKAAWVQLARGEVNVADKPEPTRRTIGQGLDTVKADYEARKKATVKNLNLIETIRAELGDRYMDSFKTKDVIAYVKSLAKPAKRKGRRSKAVADSTIRHRLGVLAKAFELENIARVEDGFDALRVPQFPKCTADHPRSGFLERAQLDILLGNLPPHLQDYILFMYISGWRKAAVASLEWGHDVKDEWEEDACVFLRGMKSKNGLPYFVPRSERFTPSCNGAALRGRLNAMAS